ncbi:MAG: tyrosine-protein phosphatase [Cyclobacteriaceae bacterium]|jgi:protein-tyrosine phosphatase|nr:capsular biosynthesis protein [Flammeovirgaceae bacterium]
MVSRLINLFSPGSRVTQLPYPVDFHSHLIPGLDDGVKTVDDSIGILSFFEQLGIKRCITTPHIMADTYPNTPDGIRSGMATLKPRLQPTQGFDAAAEYYLDEKFVQMLDQPGSLLTFDDRYLLFETNFVSEPLNLNEVIFKMTVAGYRPVLAHPERYAYLTVQKAEDVRNRGVLLQLNLLSLIGYYGRPAETMARQLIDRGLIDAVGTDTHSMAQAQLLVEVMQTRSFAKAMELPLLNYSLAVA